MGFTMQKILMVAMGMDIGGAETHVLELSCELKRMGYDIILTSNGGVYERELAEAGIPHHTLPLHNKNPFNMLRSFFGLRKIIKREQVDIVHSHARIPSFLCGILQKRMKFPFITTAHWVFSTSGLLKYLTNWGQKTIAVSEDIKTYLMDNYAVPASDIKVTINGIDTDKFSENIDSADVCKEFDLGDDKRRIVYISRMDDDRSLVAFHLLQIANRLDNEIENLEIVIVGGGNSFDRLSMLSQAVNLGAKRELVVLTGARTDINKFISTSEIFIGVSRSALEAMSAAKPVIVAGNEGYIGIFDHDKLPISIETNFTCRTCPPPTEEQLYDDIITLMCKSDEQERARLGAVSRQTILDGYSVRRMAEDCVAEYKCLPPHGKIDAKTSYDVLISGYYGFKNNGDDALLWVIIESLKERMPGASICVLSNKPAETQKTYGVSAVGRFNFAKISKIMKHTKLLISGGGSLIQDYTSTQSLIYYTSIIKMAQKRGLKTMLYANGIGPVNKPGNIKRAVAVLNKIDLITLREPESAQELKRMGIMRGDIVITADPAFCLNSASDSRIDEIFRNADIPVGAKMAGISVRNWKEHDISFEHTIAKACDYISRSLNLTCVFLVMQQPNDMNISHNIIERMQCDSFIITEDLSDAEMLGVVSTMDILLGERLHSLIYAAAASVPFVGIAYDAKINSFINYLEQDNYVPLSELNFEALRGHIDTCFNHLSNQKATLAEKAEQMRSLAQQNADMAVQLICGEDDIDTDKTKGN